MPGLQCPTCGNADLGTLEVRIPASVRDDSGEGRTVQVECQRFYRHLPGVAGHVEEICGWVFEAPLNWVAV